MALATQLLASGRGVSGSAFFFDGMSSAVDPMAISDRAYRHAENILHRGGAPRTRPGYRQVFELPEGKLQGATYFRPLAGEPSIVFAVSGRLYYAQYPFEEYRQINGVQLYQHAERVWFSTSVRSASRNADGSISAMEPRRTLVAQDGAYTRAAYWDGQSSGHSDPTVATDGSGNVLSAGIPLGSCSLWSGDRLWVARGNKLFAGDIADPLSFVENEYAGEGGFFAFDEDITALAEVPSIERPVLLVFTATRTYQILSFLRDRSLWKATDSFKSTLFPGVGCASQRSIVAQNGLLWWMTMTGLTNLNAAQQARLSSRLVPIDAPMAVSKRNIYSDLKTVALGAYENFLLCSVPYASLQNTHTWVYDQAADEKGTAESWAGIWTGTRPVEWVSGLFGGAARVFHVSQDADGKNRLWECFTAEQKDNGAEIPCFVETKTHIDFSPAATGLGLKRFVFAEVSFADVLGRVDVSVYWAGVRGKYKKLADYVLVGREGSLDTTSVLTPGSEVQTYRGQQRVLRLPEVRQDSASACSSCNIESGLTDWLDVGFSLLIVWTGRAALRSYRIFADPEQESGTGAAAYDESGSPRALEGAICS